jgi:hypothetical protein
MGKKAGGKVRHRYPRTETMASDTELITSKYLTEPLVPEATSPPGQDREARSTVSQVNSGIKFFLGFVIAMSLGCVIGTWACSSAAESTTAADWFLRIAGSDKSWKEYQADQIAKGNPRLKGDDMTWMQQLFNDAYAGNNR